MLLSLIKKFWRCKRGATAVAMAIMFVPLLVCAGAAVDFSRLASSRTLLQNTADTAAIAGVGGYQTSDAYLTAINVATATYSGTGAQLTNFVTPAGPPSIGAYCYPGSGAAKPCDAGSSTTGTLSGSCPSTWATGQSANYCVVVKQTVTLKNSLFAYVVPTSLLSVTSVATADFPYDNVNGHSFNPSPGSFSGGDSNGGAAYGVPMDAAGGAPKYGELPSAAGCAAVPTVNLLPGATAATTSTSCQYLFIANSTSSSSTANTLAIQANQPIAFIFINDTGHNGYYATDSTHYTTNLMISTTSSSTGYSYYPTGYTVPGVRAVTCKFQQQNCTPAQGQQPVTMYGQCPQHTLYGSLSPDSGAPNSDSLNVYSSAYEVQGYPPTQYTNHPLTPFVSTIVETLTGGGKTYYVRAICPNYSLSGTGISAPLAASYDQFLTGDYLNKVNVFSTWFPKVATNDAAYSDTSGAPAADTSGNALTSGNNDVFPPAVAACSPAYSTTDGGITPTSSDASGWWNWTSSNSGNCGNTTVPQTTVTASYDNCALLIEPLGTTVPTITLTSGVNAGMNSAVLPDYYLEIEDSAGNVLALDPVWDNTAGTNQKYSVDAYPGTISGSFPGTIAAAMNAAGDGNVSENSSGNVTNTDSAAWTPSTTYTYTYPLNTAPTINGVTAAKVVVRQPAYNGTTYDYALPGDTSHKCYNAQANGNLAGTVTLEEESTTSTTTGDNNNNTPIDPIENPQFGAVICNTSVPKTYALYWNDLGTYTDDDVGYWNAIYTFTCVIPTTSNAGGGAATLSG